MHQTTIDAAGVMRMRPVTEGLEVPAMVRCCLSRVDITSCCSGS
ncbi:MAG: copper chaperone PCu(A)C, partial [Caldilineaceae bacterium]|nr:copper chaperone PCu(A)C [Caldilineaceae bacterium]